MSLQEGSGPNEGPRLKIQPENGSGDSGATHGEKPGRGGARGGSIAGWETLSGKRAKLDGDDRTFEEIAAERRKAAA